MDNDAEQQAGGVDRDVPLAALDLLRRIPAARPPFSVVFTLWVSITAALGLGSRPSRSSSLAARGCRTAAHTPALANARMYSYTVPRGGKTGGGERIRP